MAQKMKQIEKKYVIIKTSIKSARVTDTMTAQQPTERKGAKVRPMVLFFKI